MSKNSLKILSWFAGFALAFLLLLFMQRLEVRDRAFLAKEATVRDYLNLNESALRTSLESIETALSIFTKTIEKNGRPLSSLKKEDLEVFKFALQGSIESVEILLMDAKGTEVSRTSLTGVTAIQSPPKTNFSDRIFFQKLQANPSLKYVISEPVFGKVQKTWLISFAKSITDRKGAFWGVVLASIPVKYFKSFNSKLALQAGGLYAVVTGDPMRFAYRYPEVERSGPGDPFFYHPNLSPVVSGAERSGVYEVISKVDNANRLLGATWVGSYPVLLLVGTEIESFKRAWRNETLAYLFGVLIFLLLFLILLLKFLKKSEILIDQQLQLANAAKLVELGEMSGAIAHEINNPLTIISASNEQLIRLVQAKSIDFAEYDKIAQRVSKTTSRISKIVIGLRKFTRTGDTNLEKLAISYVITEALDLCREKLATAGIEVIFDSKQARGEVKSNETQLMQVLINLLNNSFDALESLPQKWIRIETAVLGEFIRVTVTDSGAGISQEIAEQLMSPFFTTKGVGKGTGLGLSISKGIIESQRGRFYLNRDHANTQFVLELPKA